MLRNIFSPWDSKHAVKSPLGLVIFIGYVAWYGLSWTCVWNWRNWLGFIRILSSSVIYKASLKTRMYFQPVTDVNLVAADTMSTSFMGLYVSKIGATSHDLYVCCNTVQLRLATVLSAWLSSSDWPWNASLVGSGFMTVGEILRMKERIGAMNRIWRSLFSCSCTILA